MPTSPALTPENQAFLDTHSPYFNPADTPVALGPERNMHQFMDVPGAIRMAKTDPIIHGKYDDKDGEKYGPGGVLKAGYKDNHEDKTFPAMADSGQIMNDASNSLSTHDEPIEHDIPIGASGETHDAPLDDGTHDEPLGDDYDSMTAQENQKLLKRNPVTEMSKKSTKQLLTELGSMSTPEATLRIASGLPVGSMEAIQQMAAQIPAMVAQGSGAVTALKDKLLNQGRLPTEEEYNQASDDVTPPWVKELAQSETMQPQTYSGQLISRGLGEAFKQGSQASFGAYGAGFRASMEAMLNGEGTEGAQKRFQHYYSQLAPTGEQVGNIALLGKMGTEGGQVLSNMDAQSQAVRQAKSDLVAGKAQDVVQNKQFDQNAQDNFDNEGPGGISTTGTLPDAYPRLLPEYQVDKPIGESQAAMEEASRTADVIPGIGAVTPRIEGPGPDRLGALAVEYPPLENGFGGDLEQHPLENAPYLPGRLAEQANVDEMQGSHEMQFDEGFSKTYPKGYGDLSPRDQEIRDLLIKAQESGDAKAMQEALIQKSMAPTDGPPKIEGIDPEKTNEFVNGLYDTVDKPPRKGNVQRNKQGGYIDPSAFVEGFKRVLGLSDKNYAAFQAKAAAAYGSYRYPEEALAALANKEYKDMPVEGNIVPQNQVALIVTENPIPSFAYNHLFDRTRIEEQRMNQYAAMAKDSIKAAKENVGQAYTFFREWTKLKVQPELRGIAEAMDKDPDAIKQYFVSKGVKPELFDRFKPFIDINRNLFDYDSKVLEANHGRTLEYDPMYLSVSRPGRYHFLVTDESGGIRGVYAEDRLSDAKKFQSDVQGKLPKDWHTSDVVQVDPTKIINSAFLEALNKGNPEWLRNMAMDRIGQKLAAEKRFEMERNRNEVGGWIGELDENTQKYREKSVKQFLQSWSNRLRESHHLGNASAAIELHKAFLEDQSVLEKYSGVAHWLQTLVTRHVGMDISAVPRVDRFIQAHFNAVGRALTRIDGLLKGYEPGVNDNIMHVQAAREFAKSYTFMVSLSKLLWNTQVLAGNLFQILKTAPEVIFRHPGTFGVSPLHGVSASIKALGYMATLGKLPQFAEMKRFMQHAKDQGIIDPLGQEDYSSVERAGRLAEGPSIPRAVMKTGNAARNQIERATNYVSVLTHKFFVDSAFPALTEHQKERMTYNLSRSFTADYSRLAEMYGFQKSGTMGQFGTNFAKWKFNATARYYADLLQTMQQSRYGLRGTFPLMASLAIGFLNAGMYGTIGAVDYEAMRRMGQSTGWWDWKPLSAIISEHTPVGKMSGNQRTFFERGGITAFSDYVAQKNGMNSGPDVSGSIREMSALEAPTVAFTQGVDWFKAISTAAKAAVSSEEAQKFFNDLPEGTSKDLVKEATEKSSFGITSDDTKATMDALPSFLQEELKLRLGLVKPITYPDGSTHYVVPEKTKDEGSFIRTEGEERLARLGLKTTNENNYNEAKGYHRQLEKASQVELQSLKDGIKNNLDNTFLVDRNAKRILTEHGQDALKGLVKEMQDQQNIKGNADYFTLQELKSSKMKDQIARQRAIERIQRALDVAHQPAS